LNEEEASSLPKAQRHSRSGDYSPVPRVGAARWSVLFLDCPASNWAGVPEGGYRETNPGSGFGTPARKNCPAGIATGEFPAYIRGGALSPPGAGYRGHNAPPEHRFRIYTAGQKRRVTAQIKREFKRRAAIEPVIGHLKEGHRMGRNYLAHASGDAINVVLAAAGYNFRRLIQWLRLLLLRILIAFGLAAHIGSA
jgi:hypothetical protein